MDSKALFTKIKLARNLGEKAVIVRARTAKHGTDRQRERLLSDKKTLDVAMDTMLEKHVSHYMFSTDASIRKAAVKRILKDG